MALGAGKLVAEKHRWAGQLPEEGPGRSNRTVLALQTHHTSWPLEGKLRQGWYWGKVWLNLSFANMHGGRCLISVCGRPAKEDRISRPPPSLEEHFL